MRKAFLVLLVSFFLTFFGLLCVEKAFSQTTGDEMPAYVLFKLTPSEGDPNSEQQFQAGWPIAVRAQSQYGGKQILPKFGQLVITDATVKQVETAYLSPWQRFIDWEFIGHDWAADAHSLRVFVADGIAASMKGAITREEVETFLNRWNAEVIDIATNEVRFSATVTDAIKSEGFWGRTVPAGILTETAYDQVTGVHTTRLDYGTLPIGINELAAIITENGCEITTHKPAQKWGLFTCGRDTVFAQFKQSVKMALDGQFSLRRWRLPAAALQAIINAGGSLEVTKAQVLDVIKNRLDE